MQRNIALGLTLALLCVSGIASADPLFGGNHPLRLGFGADVGVPSGASLGLVVHPKQDWFSVSPSLTYNGLAFGGRLALKLDPLALLPNLPIGLFGDVQGGFAGEGNIPGHSDLPGLRYDYLNLYGGLRLGKPNGFHWNFEAGPTYMHINTNNFQSIFGSNANGLTIGNPTVNGWIVPTFVTGFEVVWP